MKTFSENWHRVRDVRACLRPQVRVHRQRFRGEPWFVLHDPFNNQFFRLTPAAYEFLARLDGTSTVQEAWEAALAVDPDGAPGQQDVVELLAQLYGSNLLFADLPTDTVALFERNRKRRSREMTSKWLSAMFARFPIWNPDDFLRRVLPLANLVLNPWGAFVWLATVGAGVKVAVDHWDALLAQGREVLEPANLLLLYAATVIIKLFHELGHAIFCRKFGGEVNTFGVMMMVLTPMPFVDATSAWSFRKRSQRIIVGAGGMIVEVFFAALMAFVWGATGPGGLHALAFNVMFSASVSTVLFNVNPLLRFDGYYILMDWLEMPNLYQRSLRYLRYLAERRLFGMRLEKSPARNRKERWWLASYGVLGGVYRVILFASIALFLANQFLLLGALMAVFCIIAWLFVPLGRFAAHLVSSPRLQRTRARAVAVTLGGATLLFILLSVVPFPSSVRAVGSVQADEYTLVATATSGRVERVIATSGQLIHAGEPLVELSDPDLRFELRAIDAQIQESVARQRQAIAHGGANLRTIESVLEALRKREGELLRRQHDWTVVAAHDGLWSAPRLDDFVGRWFPRGTILGEVVNPQKFVFIAKVPTRDALQLVSKKHRSAEVRLLGQSGRLLEASHWRLVQAAAEATESSGEANENSSLKEQKRAQEGPSFEVRAELATGEKKVRLLHGQTGVIRFALAWEPLVSQWTRKARQIFQNRPT